MLAEEDEFLGDERLLCFHFVAIVLLHQIFILAIIANPAVLIFIMVYSFLAEVVSTEGVFTKLAK